LTVDKLSSKQLTDTSQVNPNIVSFIYQAVFKCDMVEIQHLNFKQSYRFPDRKKIPDFSRRN